MKQENVIRKETEQYLEQHFADLELIEAQESGEYEIRAFATTLVVLPTLTTL
jgi:hypothetical protein